jgi:hypothetical protein
LNIGQTRFQITLSSADPLQQASRLLNTLLYTALSESIQCLSIRKFTLLITLEINSRQVEIGLVCHMIPFFEKFKKLSELLCSGEDAAVSAQVEVATRMVHRISASVSTGVLVPHEIALIDNICSLKPIDYRIRIPCCTTSDVLVALSALSNGCLLEVDQKGPANFRDQLLLEYLDRATLGGPVSFENFRCRNDDPESWFLSPEDPTEKETTDGGLRS